MQLLLLKKLCDLIAKKIWDLNGLYTFFKVNLSINSDKADSIVTLIFSTTSK